MKIDIELNISELPGSLLGLCREEAAGGRWGPGCFPRVLVHLVGGLGLGVRAGSLVLGLPVRSSSSCVLFSLSCLLLFSNALSAQVLFWWFYSIHV